MLLNATIHQPDMANGSYYWLNATLRYFQCGSNIATTVLHQAIKWVSYNIDSAHKNNQVTMLTALLSLSKDYFLSVMHIVAGPRT